MFRGAHVHSLGLHNLATSAGPPGRILYFAGPATTSFCIMALWARKAAISPQQRVCTAAAAQQRDHIPESDNLRQPHLGKGYYT